MVRTFETGRDDASAPNLILLHGLGHWTQAAWNRLVPALRATHRIVAFDLPGFGGSPSPNGPYTLAAYTTALRSVVAAAFHPGRVRALALLDPAGFARTPGLVARIACAALVRRLPLRLRAPRALVRATLRRATYCSSRWFFLSKLSRCNSASVSARVL